MNTMLKFSKFEVIGTTKDEAISQAAPMNLMVDATQAYKKWAKENVTNDDNVKEWMKDYLRKKKFDKPNMGAYIVIQSAVQDTRERPYKVEKPKYEKRTHTPEKFYVGRAQDTNEEIFIEKTSKAAEQAAKDWIQENQVGVNIFIEHKVKEKNSLYAKVNYTPSKGAQKAKLLVFGFTPVED
jgi:hypothetical protein